MNGRGSRSRQARGSLRRLAGDIAHGARKLILLARRPALMDAYLREHPRESCRSAPA